MGKALSLACLGDLWMTRASPSEEQRESEQFLVMRREERY